LEEADIDRRIVMKWILQRQDTIHVAHDTDKRRVVVNAAINLQVP